MRTRPSHAWTTGAVSLWSRSAMSVGAVAAPVDVAQAGESRGARGGLAREQLVQFVEGPGALAGVVREECDADVRGDDGRGLVRAGRPRERREQRRRGGGETGGGDE